MKKLKSSKKTISPFILVLFLGFLNALTPFTIDLYLPAFADIAVDLNTAVARVSLSVATYFIGFAIGQIIYGPFFDRFGRRPPLYFGLCLYLAATLGCMFSQNVNMLLGFRFLSALGGAAASVGTTTMVRDYFSPKEAPKVFSMLMLVLSVSPLFAPSIGSFIAAHFGWRIIFAFLAAIAVIDLGIVKFGLPHAYQPDPNVQIKIVPIFRKFKEVFQVKPFRLYTLAGALSFSGLFVYVAGSPSIFLEGFQVSKEKFGLIFAILACGMIGGGQINNLLMKKMGSDEIFKRFVMIQVFMSLFFIIGILTFKFTLIPTILILFILLMCSGITYPNAAALALAPITKDIGSASSLLGFVNMGCGAVLASLVGMMNQKGTLPTAVVMFISSFLALGILFFNGSEKTKEA